MTKSEYYKHAVYGHVYGLPLATPVGRLAWPFLKEKKPPMEPRPGQQPVPPRYEATIIIARDEAGKKFEAECKAMMLEMVTLFNKGRSTTVNPPVTALKDGDDPKLKEYTYYHDKWYLVARSENEFPILSSDGVSKIPADFLKGGMLVRAQVCPIFTSWGLSFRLEAIQYAGDDGQRFAGGARSQQSLLQALTDVKPPEGVEVETPSETEVENTQAAREVAPVNDPAKEKAVQQEMELKASKVKMTEEKAVPKEAPTQPVQDFKAVRAAQASKIKGKQAAIDLL